MGEIIAIRKTDKNRAEGLFGDLMQKTEDILNCRARKNNWATTAKSLNSTLLEKEVENAIKNACKMITAFEENEVELISGHRFPDIVAEKFYGVEVKSTVSNQWKSTGSSIVESTRIETVDSIYMLFGKLGGSLAEFKCRPYRDVMYDIAVTHSPRYLIDMELTKGKTIFDKLKCDYDTFRKDPDAIRKVKSYYKSQARPGQMPWWIDENETEITPMPINIRLWNTLSNDEKNYLKTVLFILFPEVVIGNYNNAALWLVSVKGIVNHCFRDSFSAGGKVHPISWKPSPNGVPKVWKTLFEHRELIKNIINDPSISPYIREYNPAIHKSKNMYESWVHQIGGRLVSQRIGGIEYSIEDILLAN